MTNGPMVASADVRMEVIEGSMPPAAAVVVELGGTAFVLPTKVGRVLLERLADCLMSAERYEQGERYRQVLRHRQALRVIERHAHGEPV